MTQSIPWRIAACLLCVTMLSGCGALTFTIGGGGDRSIHMVTVDKDDGWFNDRIAIIDVTGLIVNADENGILSTRDNPVSVLKEKLEAAKHDSRVKAVILRLNTPGGGVTASDIMYREILRFKDETHKPVVALMMDVTASGGYYVACSADRIVAYPTSVTGSIGVIVQTISFKQGLDRIGINAEAITSGPNKEVGSPLSTLTPGHRAVLQALVDNFYQRFLGIVHNARPNIPADRFKQLTDGRVISGTEAAELGLADRTGDLYDAKAEAMKMAGITHADLIAYHTASQYVGSPYAAAKGAGTSAPSQVNLIQFNLDLDEMLGGAGAGFYYLWEPGLSAGR